MSSEELERDRLRECLDCRACEHDCPLMLFRDDYNPYELMELIREGRVQEAIERPQVWWCLECQTCYELCYMNYGMVRPLKWLKQVALAQGKTPGQVASSLKLFRASGLLAKPSLAQRRKLGLPEPPRVALDELKVLLADEPA
jgi:heterodisulfide reductase subunit C